MNNTAVEDLFLREEKLTNTAGSVKASAVRDWKRWGRDHSKDLGIAVWLEGAADFTEGTIELKLLSGASEGALTAIETKTGSVANLDRNGRLAFFLLPRAGIKQFVKIEVKVTAVFKKGSTATDPVVTIGLENDSENDIDLTMVQPKIG